jgi:hypothetical protein
MTKKETLKWVVQIIASVASAILTALGERNLLLNQAGDSFSTLE